MIKVKFGLKIILGFYLIVSLIGCGLADRVLHEDKYHDYYSRQQEAEKRKLVGRLTTGSKELDALIGGGIESLPGEEEILILNKNGTL